MRKAIAALLGLPVLGVLYLAPLARRQPIARVALAFVALGLLSLAALSSSTGPATAYLSAPIDPGATVRLSAPLVTDFRVRGAVPFDFTTGMDEASVAANLTVDPVVPVVLQWSKDGRHLEVSPQAAWAPSQLYAVRIGAAARDRSGQALGQVVSATFLTRARPTAVLSVLGASGTAATPQSGVDIAFSEPVDQDTVREAFSVSPAALGRIVAMPGTDGAGDGIQHFQWLPVSPLKAGGDYTFHLAASVADVDGVTMKAPVVLAMSTLSRPALVRTRPATSAKDVARDQVISVRFTTAMQEATTEAAFHVSGRATSAGTFAWYEDETVLAWTPKSPLAYGTHYTVSIDGSATSSAGVTMGDDPTVVSATVSFTTVAKPKPVVKAAVAKPVAKAKAKPTPKPKAPPTSSAPLKSVELYYLSLLNCTHTGGWVQADGSCTGRGSNGLAPLKLSTGISNCATRPWARYLAVNGLLEHYGGSPYTGPGDRLRACGYTNPTWGENLGQWSGASYAGAIKVVLFFQSEKATNGGHWRNLMNPAFHSVGIGIWSAGGRIVYNSDFYGG